MARDRLVKVVLTAEVREYIARLAEAERATDRLADRGERVSASSRDMATSQGQAAVQANALGKAAASSAAQIDRQGKSIQVTQKLSDRSALSLGNLALAAAALGPALVPLAGGVSAAAIGLGGLGIAGLLAFGGIKQEMESGSALGLKYTASVDQAKGSIATLKATAAAGVLEPFSRTVDDLDKRMPGLSSSVSMLSRSAGETGAALSSGLLNVMQSLDPLMQTMGVHAVDLARDFERWTRGSGVSEFAAFAQQNLPAVERFLGELATTAGHLIQAFAPLGGQTLAAITAVSTAINAIPIPILTLLVSVSTQAGLAFKAWGAISGLITGASAALAKVATSGTAATTSLTTTSVAATKAGASMAVVASGSTRASVALTGTALAASRASKALALMNAAAVVGGVAVAAAQFDSFIGKAAAADVSTKDLVKSFDGLATGSGNASGALADVFRESGSKVNIFGHQIGKQREEVVSLDDVTKRFAQSSESAFGQGLSDKLGRLQNGKGVGEFKEEVRQLDVALASMVSSGNADKAKQSFDNLLSGIKDPAVKEQVAGMFTAYNGAVDKAGASAQAAGPKLDGFGNEIKKSGDAAKDAADATKRLSDGIRNLGRGLLQQEASASGFQAAIDGATDSLKENGRTLNLGTEAGRSNAQALRDIVTTNTEWAASTVAQTKNQAQGNAILAAGRAQYIATATAMGKPRAEAERLAAELFKLPPDVSTSVSVPGATDAAYTVDKLGNVVLDLNGKKVDIPLSVPNAEAVAKSLSGIDAQVITANSKAITLQVSAPLAPAVRAQIEGLAGVSISLDGRTITVNPSAPGAPATLAKIKGLTTAADILDGKAPNVSTSTDAPESRRSMDAATRAAQILDGQNPYVTAGTNAKGIQGIIEAARNAARDKTFTITTRYSTIGAPSTYGVAGIGGRAMGGPAYFGPDYLPGYNSGGEVFDALRGGRVSGAGSRTSDSVLTKGRAGLYATSDYEHIWTGQDVDNGGGHGMQYMMRELARQGRLQKVVKAGMLAGFAGGGSTGMEGWDPDLSAIISLTGSLRVDAATVAEAQTKAKTTADALTKATRDLRAARARSAGLSSKASAATKISAANALTTALEKQAMAQAAATSAERTYQSQKKASTSSSAALFLQATGTTNSGMQAFLDDIDTIRRKGQPKLALSLLQDGSEDSRKTAHDLARGSKSQLLNAASGLATSDRLQDRKDATLKALTGSPTASYEERTKANAAALALRGATNAAYNNAGPSVRASFASEFAAMAKAITIQPGRVDMHLDGRVIGQATTNFQSTEAGYGSTTPGVEKQ